MLAPVFVCDIVNSLVFVDYWVENRGSKDIEKGDIIFLLIFLLIILCCRESLLYCCFIV